MLMISMKKLFISISKRLFQNTVLSDLRAFYFATKKGKVLGADQSTTIYPKIVQDVTKSF